MLQPIKNPFLPPLFFFLYAVIFSCCGQQNGPEVPGNTYLNPVFEPTFADPSVIRTPEGIFYAYATQDDWGDGQRLIPIIRSNDLVNWEYLGDAFEEKPSWKTGGLWAPQCVEYDNKYFLFYSLSVWGDEDPGIGYAVSNRPEGPFHDRGPFIRSQETGVENSIDPYFFHDISEGKLWLFWGSFHGIFATEMTYDEGRFRLKGEKVQIAGRLFEGSCIHKKGGYYYYFGSVGTCCEGSASTYHVRVGRSSCITGPYADRSGRPLLENDPRTGTLVIRENPGPEGFAGPGHHARIVTDDEGNDWLVYHAIRKDFPRLPNGATRRPLMIDRLYWNDGWPGVKENQPSTQPVQAPVINP